MLFPHAELLVRGSIAGVLLIVASIVSGAQTPQKFPPDSLVNTKVIPKSTPVIQVIGTMRNFTFDLGVRCQFCHVGQEGQPLSQFDFPSDTKRTKLVARQMMLLVAEANRRVDTLPGHQADDPQVTCATCHRGVSKPMPLSAVIAQTASSAGADSAIAEYRALRQRYYGSGSYDFGEGQLNTAAFRLGRANKFDDAFAVLGLNEQLYPNSSGMSVFRGNILLMKGDTTAAAQAFREAVRRDSTNNEARGRLRAIGQPPH
ncbi:MAG: c-type cytochrome [Gemmatimonadaceae bacterium]